ncbi:MAG: ankyrin repeat domain-containing protein, partial [Nitrosopumilus sp.]
MKAKFVYEYLGDIFKPKSEEEIWSSMGDLSPDTLFYKSAENGFLPGIKKALKDGANVHIQNDYALLLASQNDYYDVVKFLLENGADVHANDDLALRIALR